MNRAGPQRDVGIADAYGLRGVIFRPPGPLQLAVPDPLPCTVPERPFGMREAHILEQDQLPSRAIGGKTAVGMLRERRGAAPRRRVGLIGRSGFRRAEFKDLRAGRTLGDVRVGHQRRIRRQKEAAVMKTGQWTRLPRAMNGIGVHLPPAGFVSRKECPTTIVQRLEALKGFDTAGEKPVPNSRQTGRTVAPHRMRAVVGGVERIDVLFYCHNELHYGVVAKTLHSGENGNAHANVASRGAWQDSEWESREDPGRSPKAWVPPSLSEGVPTVAYVSHANMYFIEGGEDVKSEVGHRRRIFRELDCHGKGHPFYYEDGSRPGYSSLRLPVQERIHEQEFSTGDVTGQPRGESAASVVLITIRGPFSPLPDHGPDYSRSPLPLPAAVLLDAAGKLC